MDHKLILEQRLKEIENTDVSKMNEIEFKTLEEEYYKITSSLEEMSKPRPKVKTESELMLEIAALELERSMLKIDDTQAFNTVQSKISALYTELAALRRNQGHNIVNLFDKCNNLYYSGNVKHRSSVIGILNKFDEMNKPKAG